jgi:restriction system protein
LAGLCDKIFKGGVTVAVPDFQTLMLPVLRLFANGQERGLRDAVDPIAREFRLTHDDITAVLPTKRQTRLRNRIGWAHNYLKQSGLLESPRRGVYRITERGQSVLKSGVNKIDINFLSQYPEFLEFRSRSGISEGDPNQSVVTSTPAQTDLTPDELVRAGYERLHDSLRAQLLERVKQASPEFFESLVIELLVAMGYGGSREDAARVVGRSGDEGIDGIIKEDRLGLENIYVQAKRWENTVGRPTIQQFAGALQGQRARKGVLLTTSNFSRDAIEYANGLQVSIVLVDGLKLADLMIEFGIGVTEFETVRLKRLDEDYFIDE